jgi:queuine/archaeosine tRNA-ribosyltransferase
MNAEPLACDCAACRRFERAVTDHEHALRAMHSQRNYGQHTLPPAGGTSREVRRASKAMDRHHLAEVIESPTGRHLEAHTSEAHSEAQRTEPGIGARDVVATNPNNRKEPKP